MASQPLIFLLAGFAIWIGGCLLLRSVTPLVEAGQQLSLCLAVPQLRVVQSLDLSLPS